MNGCIYKDGSFVHSSGEEFLKVRLKNRMSLYLGEWFLEPSEGIDWWNLRGIAPDINAIRFAVSRALSNDPEVISIISVDVEVIDSPDKAEKYGRPLRTGIIRANVKTVYGVMEATA